MFSQMVVYGDLHGECIADQFRNSLKAEVLDEQTPDVDLGEIGTQMQRELDSFTEESPRLKLIFLMPNPIDFRKLFGSLDAAVNPLLDPYEDEVLKETFVLLNQT